MSHNVHLDLFQQIAEHAIRTDCLTVGLVSGHRLGNDVRCVHRFAGQVISSLVEADCHEKMLVCRIIVERPLLKRFGLGFKERTDQEVVPPIRRSAIGNWFQVDVPITLGDSAPWMLQQIPKLLPQWKQQYRLILIDLGPIHLVTSRAIGRLCDANYLLLGPNSSASADWLLQYVDYHAYCGSNIVGTMLASFAA